MVLIEFHRLNGAANFFFYLVVLVWAKCHFDRVSFLPDFSRFVKFTTRFLELQVLRAFFILIGCFLSTHIPISMKTGPYYQYSSARLSVIQLFVILFKKRFLPVNKIRTKNDF